MKYIVIFFTALVLPSLVDFLGKDNIEKKVKLPIHDSESHIHNQQNHDEQQEQQGGIKQIWKQYRRTEMTLMNHLENDHQAELHLTNNQSLNMYSNNRFYHNHENENFDNHDTDDERSDMLESFRGSIEMTSPPTKADLNDNKCASLASTSKSNSSSSFSNNSSSAKSTASSNNNNSLHSNRSIRFEGDDDTKSSLTNDPDLNIDEDIVTNILRDSKQRSIKLQHQKSVNRMCNIRCWKRALIGTIAFFSVVASTLVTFLLVGYHEEGKEKDEPNFNSEGSFGFCDDHSNYHNHVDYENDLHVILQDPIRVDERMIPIHMMHHLVDRDQVIDANENIVYAETPFFWKVPHTGHVIESVMSKCFNLALASDVIDTVMPDMLQHSNKVSDFINTSVHFGSIR